MNNKTGTFEVSIARRARNIHGDLFCDLKKIDDPQIIWGWFEKLKLDVF